MRGAVLNEDWTADVVGRMHRCKISSRQLAEEAGYTPAYLSTVLNGKKDLGAESKERTKNRIFQALERLETLALAPVDVSVTEGGADVVSVY